MMMTEQMMLTELPVKDNGEVRAEVADGGPDGEDGIDGGAMEKTTQMASTAMMLERETMVTTAQMMNMELTETTGRTE